MHVYHFSDIGDVYEILEVTVFDDNGDYNYEFLGMVFIFNIILLLCVSFEISCTSNANVKEIFCICVGQGNQIFLH